MPNTNRNLGNLVILFVHLIERRIDHLSKRRIAFRKAEVGFSELCMEIRTSFFPEASNQSSDQIIIKHNDKGSFVWYVRKIFQKTNIPYPPPPPPYKHVRVGIRG